MFKAKICSTDLFSFCASLGQYKLQEVKLRLSGKIKSWSVGHLSVVFFLGEEGMEAANKTFLKNSF